MGESATAVTTARAAATSPMATVRASSTAASWRRVAPSASAVAYGSSSAALSRPRSWKSTNKATSESDPQSSHNAMAAGWMALSIAAV